MAEKTDNYKVVAENRKARYEYKVDDAYEAGISLTGTEVKSLRTGQANIAESYASAENGGIFLINAYIPEYKQAGSFFQHEPRRPRRLLQAARGLGPGPGEDLGGDALPRERRGRGPCLGRRAGPQPVIDDQAQRASAARPLIE